MSILITWGGVLQAKDPKSNPIAEPDGKGPYDVGFTTFCATMSAGRVTRIQVYYPKLPANSNAADCPNTYPIYPPVNQNNPVATCAPAGGAVYSVSSPLCAVQDAAAAPGPFPLIVHDHGGGVAGADYQRVSQVPVHEALASHGFVVATAIHSANAVNRVLDLPIVLDTLLARNAKPGDALFGRIDADRVGISGLSAGGQATLLTVGGLEANGIAGDSRFKAMVVYEPPGLVNVPPIVTDLAKISIPYLVMGGDQFRQGIVAIPTWFDLTVEATPRIFVYNPTALHFSYQSGSCRVLEDAREYALANDPALIDPQTQALIDPLSNLVTDPNTGIRSCKTSMGTAGANACALWNQGEFQFPLNGFGFRSGRNTCTRTGIDSILPLDVDPVDGLTDTPPFLADDSFNLSPAITDEELVPLIQLYTVAFWKKFLEGDGRYMRYLAPGYAKVRDLNAVVEIAE